MSPTKIEELTPEQKKIMDEVAVEFEEFQVGGDDFIDEKSLERGIAYIYKKEGVKISICDSVLKMVVRAKIQQGTTIDYFGGGYSSGWTAFYTAFQKMGIDDLTDTEFDIWRDFVLSGAFATVLYEDEAFVCRRPMRVLRDADHNLHCENGLAIQWRDGTGWYFLHGVAIDDPQWVLTPAEKLDPKIILGVKNAEVRRELVRKIGIDRICHALNARCIDSKGDYELLLLDIGDGEGRPYLKMKNPSIGVYHVEGVPRSCTTVDAALAWRNGDIESPPEILT